jgi:membrane complex biogenesis BtpA family protein
MVRKKKMVRMQDLFGTSKPIIALLHLRALPVTPSFKMDIGDYKEIIAIAKRELNDLQRGGVDAVMFSNEFDFPYISPVDNVTIAIMARIVGELYNDIKVPFGVNVISDAKGVMDLAKATEANFVRAHIHGAWAGERGLVSNSFGPISRHMQYLGIEDLPVFTSINEEGAEPLVKRPLASVVHSLLFNFAPAGLCVSGLSAGHECDTSMIEEAKQYAGDTPVLCNTGCNLQNVPKQLPVSDGGFVGTTFKKDGKFWEQVEYDRVKEFMDLVKKIRGNN